MGCSSCYRACNVNNTTPISRSYSMFDLLVNFIDEKRRIDRES